MDNIDPDQYETIAEELVFEYLQNQGEDPKWVKPAPRNIQSESRWKFSYNRPCKQRIISLIIPIILDRKKV